MNEAEKKFLNDQAWSREILAVISSFPKGRVFTSDEIRAEAERLETRSPSHPNKWGMVLKRAKALWMVRQTGQYRPSARADANKRIVAVWERI